MPPETAARSYEPVASFYQGLAHVFSLGQIRAAKASQLPELSPGQRVLYVGVGSAEDAILAARAGAGVTCLDLSPGMLERARRRFSAAGHEAEFLCCDVVDHRPSIPYDAVAANFFLNIFPEPVMERVLGCVVSLVRPGGKLLIADFAPPKGNLLLRALQILYYRLANLSFWALGLAPLHPIYDYAQYFPKLGVDLKGVRSFRLSRIGPVAYQSLVGIRAPR